jgi:hypothetical protein
VNFTILVGDVVTVRPNRERTRGLVGIEMIVIREFGHGIFWCEGPDGFVWRLHSAELDRARRPSDERRRAEIDERLLVAERRRQAELVVIENNARMYARVRRYGVRLTAKGLPDGRMKFVLPPRIRAKGR